MSFKGERKENNHQGPTFHDFKDWNMYKCYLFDRGKLNPDLDFDRVPWKAYLASKGRVNG